VIIYNGACFEGNCDELFFLKFFYYLTTKGALLISNCTDFLAMVELR